MKKTCLLILLGCLCSISLLAQFQIVSYENAPKKAKASFDKAIEAFRNYQSAAAIGYLEEA